MDVRIRYIPPGDPPVEGTVRLDDAGMVELIAWLDGHDIEWEG